MTNAIMSREELAQLASASSVALGRRITPVGTSYDGDVVFATSPLHGLAATPLQVEVLAVAALEGAIERAVRLARGRDGIPGLADTPTRSRPSSLPPRSPRCKRSRRPGASRCRSVWRGIA